jgi:hypothetical protein
MNKTIIKTIKFFGFFSIIITIILCFDFSLVEYLNCLTGVYGNFFSLLVVTHGLSLNAFYFVGLTDAEGSFIVSVNPDKKSKTGWKIQVSFQIQMLSRDHDLLFKFQQTLGGIGKVSYFSSGLSRFQVQSNKELLKIIDFFEKYPLITQKRADFELFKMVVHIMNQKEHLTPEGLQRVVEIRASLNKGLTKVLNEAFPKIIPISRPTFLFQGIPDPQWVAGFTEGEGCFSFWISKSKASKSGSQVRIRFSLSQHTRDAELLKSFDSFFGCGHYHKKSDQILVGEFIVDRISDIEEKIIPFFDKYSFQGYKALAYENFKKVLQIIKEKRHLTKEGLEEVRKIQQRVEGDEK